MKRVMRAAAVLGAALTFLQPSVALADHISCGRGVCPHVESAPGVLTAAYMEQGPGGGWTASNAAPIEHPYRYRLSHPCVIDDRLTQTCRAGDFQVCPVPPNRNVEDLVIEQQRLTITGPGGVTTTVDGYDPREAPVGTPVGEWLPGPRGCIDITALNPAPSPAEVFRYFQTLPLPQLSTKQQPPGNGLVGLPVIFYTDSPTTQTFTLTIRGFTVDVVAGATAFTWHTGDGAHLTSTDPGAPYPQQTVTHDYRSGSYTAYLTTTWAATFRVNGGAPVAVPGTTTTDGPPVTFAVLQARPVLTNPYD
jgi:hypothetical protein